MDVPGITRPETSVALPPATRLMSGVMMLLVSAVTIDVKAPPMMTPTAMSITLPRLMNSLNSSKNCFTVSLLMIGSNSYPSVRKLCGLRRLPATTETSM